MKKISDFRKEEFKILYNRGLNDYEIAEQMELSKATIFRWRKSLGLQPKGTKPKARNKSIQLSQEEKEILCGTLLGDSSIQYYPKFGWKSPKFKCDHGPQQKEYAELLCYKLKNLNTTLKKYERFDKRTNKVYITYSVNSCFNPELFYYYNELYNTGVKHITETFLKDFTIKSLAYLYMDDGYFHNQSQTAYISTDSFLYEDVILLSQYLKNNFNLHFNLIKVNKGFRLRLLKKDFNKFVSLIKPYIIESLQYKLNSVS